MFVVDYVSRWPTFMEELLSLLQYGTHAADLYFKILLAIDAEVCILFVDIFLKLHLKLLGKKILKFYCIIKLIVVLLYNELNFILFQIVDREVLHSQAETERNNLIKDKMRERCVVEMSNSWYDVLVSYF